MTAAISIHHTTRLQLKTRPPRPNSTFKMTLPCLFLSWRLGVTTSMVETLPFPFPFAPPSLSPLSPPFCPTRVYLSACDNKPLSRCLLVTSPQSTTSSCPLEYVHANAKNWSRRSACYRAPISILLANDQEEKIQTWGGKSLLFQRSRTITLAYIQTDTFLLLKMNKALLLTFLTLACLSSLAPSYCGSEIQIASHSSNKFLVDAFGANLVFFVAILAGLLTCKLVVFALDSLQHAHRNHLGRESPRGALISHPWYALEIIPSVVIFWLLLACIIHFRLSLPSFFTIADDESLLHSKTVNGIRLYSILEIIQYAALTNAFLNALILSYVVLSK